MRNVVPKGSERMRCPEPSCGQEVLKTTGQAYPYSKEEVLK